MSDRLTITVEGKDYELVAYAGVIQLAARAIGGVEGMVALATDADIQRKFVEVFCSNYNEKGENTGLKFNVFTLDTEIFSEILSWGMENVSDFFMRAAEKMRKIEKTVKERQEKLLSPAS